MGHRRLGHYRNEIWEMTDNKLKYVIEKLK